IVTGDATLFSVPRDVTFVYFFNPFRGPLMEQVLQNVAESLRATPRKVTLFCAGSPADEGLFIPFNVLSWLTLKLKATLPTGCIGTFYENSMWTGEQARLNPNSAVIPVTHFSPERA